METAQNGDFIALRYSGYANGELFDSNEPENLKKIKPDAEARELIIVAGKGMVVPGLDRALAGKEIGKQQEIHIKAIDGFGERRRELVKTIPLKVFTEKRISPYPGLVLAMDDMVAKVLAVSGARVITDFNNQLAGKELKYTFTIVRKVTDEKEKAEALFLFTFHIVPDFSIGEKITVRGPEIMETYVRGFSGVFKEMIGKELAFELKEKKEEAQQETTAAPSGHEH